MYDKKCKYICCEILWRYQYSEGQHDGLILQEEMTASYNPPGVSITDAVPG